MNLVAGPVQIISERYSSTIAASAVCKRVLAFLDAPTDEANSWGSEPLTQIETVTLNDISCRRDDREILKHVDLTLQKGDRVALLGESGAGKIKGDSMVSGRLMRGEKMKSWCFREKVKRRNRGVFVKKEKKR